MSRSGALSSVVACLALCSPLGAAALANGQSADVPPPAGYTLDGVASSAQDALGSGHECSATVDATGTMHCFSSRQGMAGATAAALSAGAVPPGWGALPPKGDVAGLVARYTGEAQTAGPLSLPLSGAPSTARAARKHGRWAAHAADGTDCSVSVVNVWTDWYFGGSYGYTGYSGYENWLNYVSPFNNSITSFWVMPTYTTRWHDYANGSGAYYGNGYPCRYVYNLGNANMTDGGTANDRFSSVATW